MGLLADVGKAVVTGAMIVGTAVGGATSDVISHGGDYVKAAHKEKNAQSERSWRSNAASTADTPSGPSK